MITNITISNPRMVISTMAESDNLRLKGTYAYHESGYGFLEGRILLKEGETYVGRYVGGSIYLKDKSQTAYRTEASEAVSDLYNYVKQLNRNENE